MRETQWILDTPGGQYSLALGPASRSLLRTTHDPSARRALEAWLMAARGAGRARWLMDEVGRSLARPLARETPGAEALVRAAFAEGQLRLERLPDRVPHGREERIESYAHDGVGRSAAEDELTWIAIRLEYDDDSGQGVAYARYVLRLPDGGVREGTLDRNGNARVDGLHPGMCEVTFPDYDSRKGAPPAKVPPGKGHQPRRAPLPQPMAKIATPHVAEPSRSSTLLRCRAEGIEFLEADGSLSKHRQPGVERVIQFVPNPSKQSSGELGNAVVNKVIGLKAPEVRRTSEIKWGGERRFGARCKPDISCGHKHPVLIHGAEHEMALRSDTERGELRSGRSGPREWEVSPAVYTAEVRGCEGSSHQVRLEVFPSDQRIESVSLEAVCDALHSLEHALTPLKELGLSFELTLAAGGKLETFDGWREDDDNWMVYHSAETRLQGIARMEAKAEASILALVWHVPSAMRNILGDVGLVVELKFNPTLSFEGASRRYPAAPAESRDVDKGSLEGVIGGAFGLFANAGAPDCVGARLTGAIETELKVAGEITVDRRVVTVTSTTERGEVKGKVTLLTRALWWKTEDSWDITLMEKRPADDPKLWALLDLNKSIFQR